MNKRKLYKTAGIAFGALLICFIVFWRFHGITVSVDKTARAIECGSVDGKTQEREIEIRISGRYSYKLWAADSFSGKIEIEGYGQTAGEVSDLRIEKNAALIYREYDRAVLNTFYLGVISAESGFSDFEILVDDGEGIDMENPELIIYFAGNK
ncbi:MAG: hypothetical protein NC223_11530 [Butyrivibrio sp.]|nr:hypothetical protein [Butyrivibrio sp.]